MKMFLIYSLKDKTKFIVLKSAVFISIVLMGYLAFNKLELELPSLTSKIELGFGLIGIAFVVLLGFLNRLKHLFKFKSVGFIVIAFILYFLRMVIDSLSLSFALVAIPLLIDDLVIDNYFKYINMTRYFEHYKFIGAHHEWKVREYTRK